MKLIKHPTIFHIDMDAFYASVEQADQPRLQGKSVLIGGKSKRSVVSAASYEARRFGVRSAMPMSQALERCPEAVVLPVRMARYKILSKQIMAVLDTFSPLVEQVSIDEAFLDVTGFELLYSDAEKMALSIKQQIQKKFNLTCSIGVAPVKFLAKIASDLNKPDGIMIIQPHQVDSFIKTLPVGKIPGVGKKNQDILTKIGVRFLGDVTKIPDSILTQNLGKFGRRLTELARGFDSSAVQSHRKTKCFSSEETFLDDITDANFLKTSLLKHAEEVGKMLRIKSVKAKTVSIKIKHADFLHVSRSMTLPSYTQSAEQIYKVAGNLLVKYGVKKPIRLIGVTVSLLCPSDHPEQISLFKEETPAHENWEKVEHVLDAISEKYGEDVVKKAGLTMQTGRKKEEK